LAWLHDQRLIDVGQGIPLLLLHGFCETASIFDGLLPALAQASRVVCPLLPGHGGRAWDPTWRSLDDAACWLRDLLDALEIERCVLVGHSLGGYIAAAFADQFPERLAGLGMLHSTALADAPERRETRTKAIQFVETHGKEPFLKAFVQGLFHAPEPLWLATLDKITAPTDVNAILALTRIMRDRPDRSAAVQRLQVPVMYITGEHDALVSPERSRQELADLKIALLHRIPEASHMGMYEAPEKVLAAILSLVGVCG
jgi:pimeloyl-ACP methyl ester carboxylesterase